MPSRPPLLSEIKPSTSGIIQDPHTGDRKVAPTKRPDGTLRKEIKIRPGFTPEEDVSKFRSARQNDSQSRQLPKGSVVGFVRPQEAVAQSALMGMSEAQKKNVKRKEKRKATKSEATPDQWDEHSSTGSLHPDHQPEAPAKQLVSSSETLTTPNSTLESKANRNTGGQALFKSALKSTSLNPETPPQQHLVPPKNIPQELVPPSSSTNKKPLKGKEGHKLFASALQSIDVDADQSAEAVEKKARAIRKKLTQAQQLKIRHEKGESLLAEQMDKISKIDELTDELESLKIIS